VGGLFLSIFVFKVEEGDEVYVNVNLPVKKPLVFETNEQQMNEFFDFHFGFLMDNYLIELYKSIGLNDPEECDNNKILLPIEDQPPQNPDVPYRNFAVSESCLIQYNSFQYLKTGNLGNLNAITSEDARKTAQAIRENNPDLCPGMEYPSCLLAFKLSCIDKNYLAEDGYMNELLREHLLEYLSFINLGLLKYAYLENGSEEDDDKEDIEDIKDKEYILEVFDLYEEYFCDLLFSRASIKREIALGTLDVSYCSYFNKDKNILERLFYLQCMNFAQADINYCLDEIRSINYQR